MTEIERIAAALERIAAALESAIAVPAEPAAPVSCPHPEDQRVDFGGMGEAGSFHCKTCGQSVEAGV